MSNQDHPKTTPMVRHSMKRFYTGEGIEGGVQPTCSCGWTGRVEHAWNDWQMTNVAEQEREHLSSLRKDKP